MSDRIVQIGSETTYDTLADALDAVVRVCSSPCTLEEIGRVAGSKDLPALATKLDRLVKDGVLRKDGDRYEAAGAAVYAPRQESVVGMITRLMLPSIFRAVHQGKGFAVQVDLALDPAAQRALRSEFMAPLNEKLTELSEVPGDDRIFCSMVTMGTADVPPAGELEERVIETVRRASLQRSNPAAADRAFLVQLDGYFAPSAKAEAEALIRTMAQDLKNRWNAAPGTRPNYTVAVGFSARDGDGGVK